MPNHDAFSAQLVDFVRKMSDDAILALVRAQIGGIGGSLPQARAAVSSALASAKADRPAGRRPGRPASKPAAAAPVASAPAAHVASPKAKVAKAAPKAKVAKAAPKPAAKFAKAAPKPAAKAAKPAPKSSSKAGSAKRGRGSAAGRMELLSAVERIVKSSGGVSASEVAKSAGVPQSRASSALKELKLAKRVFQGGDRRFARYAGSAGAAQAASDGARRNASGPVTKGKKK